MSLYGFGNSNYLIVSSVCVCVVTGVDWFSWPMGIVFSTGDAKWLIYRSPHLGSKSISWILQKKQTVRAAIIIKETSDWSSGFPSRSLILIGDLILFLKKERDKENAANPREKKPFKDLKIRLIFGPLLTSGHLFTCLWFMITKRK